MTILLCGIGNLERGDDGFGPHIIQNLSTTRHIKTLNCGLHIENYLNKIVEYKPDLIIILDAIAGGEREIWLLQNEEIVQHQALSVTTHNIPFSALYEYIKTHSQADVWLLGVTPRSYEHFTERTEAFAHHLIQFFDSLDKQSKIDILNIYETVSSIIGFQK